MLGAAGRGGWVAGARSLRPPGLCRADGLDRVGAAGATAVCFFFIARWGTGSADIPDVSVHCVRIFGALAAGVAGGTVTPLVGRGGLCKVPLCVLSVLVVC